MRVINFRGDTASGSRVPITLWEDSPPAVCMPPVPPAPREKGSASTLGPFPVSLLLLSVLFLTPLLRSCETEEECHLDGEGKASIWRGHEATHVTCAHIWRAHMLHTCNNQERGNLGSSQAGASQQDPPPASSLLPNPHSCPSPLSVTPGKVYHSLFGWSHQAYPAGKVTHFHWLESSPPGSDLSTSSTQAPRPTQGHTRCPESGYFFLIHHIPVFLLLNSKCHHWEWIN